MDELKDGLWDGPPDGRKKSADGLTDHLKGTVNSDIVFLLKLCILTG